MKYPVASCVIINKNERSVATTLDALELQIDDLDDDVEIVVVDASGGALDDLYVNRERVRVERFEAPAGVRVSIPHQRNHGIAVAAAEVVVFIDAGCVPGDEWLGALLAGLRNEDVVAGRTVAGTAGINSYEMRTKDGGSYVSECPTINLAFRRATAQSIGGFDESFEYGSDVDFSWRLVDAGIRIRYLADAVVETDWGSWRRQVRRSFVYGRARVRLYRKHRGKRREILRRDPVAVVYPLFLLGLPLALRWPWYSALLLVPVWRNRRIGGMRVTLDHFVYGAGVLAELAATARGSYSR